MLALLDTAVVLALLDTAVVLALLAPAGSTALSGFPACTCTQMQQLACKNLLKDSVCAVSVQQDSQGVDLGLQDGQHNRC